MSAEALRRAARNIRADYPDAGDDPDTFMRAVADWLDKEADAYEQYRASATTLALRVAPALAVARAYLGDQP